MSIRTLICDDESLARDELRRALAPFNEFELIAECANGTQAIERGLALRPDVLFVDIEMRSCTGLDVVRAVSEHYQPYFVFVTAYRRYALDAYQIDAHDYLVKPIDRQRFAQVIAKIHQSHQLNQAYRLHQKNTPDHLIVKLKGETRKLRLDQIEWIEAAGNYAGVQYNDQAVIVRSTLTALHQRLDSSRFLRVHRSMIVNLDHVVSLLRPDGQDDQLQMTAGRVINVGRTFRHSVREQLLQR